MVIDTIVKSLLGFSWNNINVVTLRRRQSLVGFSVYKNSVIYGTGVLLLCFFIVGCSITRHVPPDRYLVKKVKIYSGDKAISPADIQPYIQQKPNSKLLDLFPVGLRIYNLTSKEGKPKWLAKLGEAPVLWDDLATEQSIENIESYLFYSGYLNNQVSHGLIYGNKKVTVEYFVEPGEVFALNRTELFIKDSIWRDAIIRSDFLEEGNFDQYELEQKRKKVSAMMKNSGRYFYNEDYISIIADTLPDAKQTNIEIMPNPRYPDSVIQLGLKPARITHYHIYIEGKPSTKTVIDSEDTLLSIDNYSFYYPDGNITIKPQTIIPTIWLSKAPYFRQEDLTKSIFNLYGLNLFRHVDFSFSPIDKDADTILLEARVDLKLSTKQSVSIGGDLTNSSGNLGLGAELTYANNNLSGGAERLTSSTRFSSISIKNLDGEVFNSLDAGITTQLQVPGLLFNPFHIKNLWKNTVPKTEFSALVTYQDQANFTRITGGGAMGYNWSPQENQLYRVTWLDLDYVLMEDVSDEFLRSISDNVYVQNAFTSHFVWGMRYGYTYNTQTSVAQKKYNRFSYDLHTAGNFLNLYKQLFTPDQFVETGQDKYYTFTNVRFTQMIKGVFEYSFSQPISRHTSMASRAMVGCVIPYGNSNIVPADLQFSAGGANDMRAWTPWTLGPGTTPLPSGTFPNQTGDIKLLYSLEFRSVILPSVELGVFTDVGNIWSLPKEFYDESSQFKFNTFYKELAAGVGLGIRWITPYFILRVDEGMKIFDPTLPAGQHFIPMGRKFQKSDFVLNIAVGYPF